MGGQMKKSFLQPGPGPEGEHYQDDVDRDFCRKHCAGWMGHRKKGDPGWCSQTYFLDRKLGNGKFLCVWTHEKKKAVISRAAKNKRG